MARQRKVQIDQADLRVAYLVEDDLPQVWWQGRGLLGELLIGELLAPDLLQARVTYIQPWEASQKYNHMNVSVVVVGIV